MDVQQLRTVREAKSLTLKEGTAWSRAKKVKNVLNPVNTVAQSVAKIAELDLQENLNALCGELEEQLVALKVVIIHFGSNFIWSNRVLNIAFAHFLDKAQELPTQYLC